MNNSGASRPSALGLFPNRPTPRLYDGVVEVLRTRHYSGRTEEAYGEGNQKSKVKRQKFPRLKLFGEITSRRR